MYAIGNMVMCHLTMGCILRNVSLGDFVIVGTSQSALTQTWMAWPTPHLGYMVQVLLPGYNLQQNSRRVNQAQEKMRRFRGVVNTRYRRLVLVEHGVLFYSKRFFITGKSTF